MKVLISEQQYKSIILEEAKKDVKSLMDTQMDMGRKAIEDASKWIGFDYKFLLTYAMGIGGLLPTVTKWLYNQESTLDEAQVTALIISAISLVFFETKNQKQIKSKFEEKGLGNELEKTVNFLDKTKDWLSNLFDAVPEIVMKASNILAYTFLLPLSAYITNIVPDVNSVDAMIATIEGVAMNKVANFSGAYLRTLLQDLITKIRR
jgi:uncharacterized protein involved in cysteine biosynthesis